MTATVAPEVLAELKFRMETAQDAWFEARGVVPSAELAVLAKIVRRLEGEYRAARMGIVRRSVPADRAVCGRCGGYGGSSAWPGFVCYECGGLGHVAPTA